MPKVNVRILTYDCENALREMLETVFTQIYKNCEVAIVNNNSTDSTDQMVKKGDCPIRYFWQNNSNLSDTRNKPTEFAEEEHITFVESDGLHVENRCYVNN